MNRRSVLAASGVALSTVIAGCSSDGDTPDGSSDGDTLDGECELIHDLDPSRVKESYDGVPVETYRYGDLSTEAQQVFDEALADGVYFTTNQSLRSEEFQYGDVQSIYHVIHHNETHVMATYVNEGCRGP